MGGGIEIEGKGAGYRSPFREPTVSWARRTQQRSNAAFVTSIAFEGTSRVIGQSHASETRPEGSALNYYLSKAPQKYERFPFQGHRNRVLVVAISSHRSVDWHVNVRFLNKIMRKYIFHHPLV